MGAWPLTMWDRDRNGKRRQVSQEQLLSAPPGAATLCCGTLSSPRTQNLDLISQVLMMACSSPEAETFNSYLLALELACV